MASCRNEFHPVFIAHRRSSVQFIVKAGIGEAVIDRVNVCVGPADPCLVLTGARGAVVALADQLPAESWVRTYWFPPTVIWLPSETVLPSYV